MLFSLLIFALLAAETLCAQAYFITTIAGTGERGFDGDGGSAIRARLDRPSGVAVDAFGNIFISDSYNHRIRRIGTDGTIRTYAGSGEAGFAGDGGPALQARFNFPNRIALDPQGNLFIADELNNRVRRVDTNGIITTVAGNGTGSVDGDYILATGTGTVFPTAVAVDGEGNLYVSLYYPFDARIRKVTPGPFGIITTVAGRGIYGLSGDDGPALNAEIQQVGVGVDASNNVYIAENGYQVRRVGSSDGIIRRFAGDGNGGNTGDGGQATAATCDPLDVAAGRNGVMFLLDRWQDQVRQVSPDGIIETIAGSVGNGYSGDGGPATQAQLNDPGAITTDGRGNIYIADTWNDRVRKLTPAGTFSLSPSEQAFEAEGGMGSAELTVTPAGIPWRAVSLVDWITVSSAARGAASATLTYVVAPNRTGAPRVGSVFVAGEILTVKQAE